MSENYESALTYNSYLAVDELLKLQRPLSTGPEHDEMLFIIIHQTYELWFKQLIHEFKQAQSALEAGDTHYSLSILGRIRTILKLCVAQIDILKQNSIWDSTLEFVTKRGHQIPKEVLTRDKSIAYSSNEQVQDVLLKLHQSDPQTAMVCERLVDIDEGLQEWRYRHVKMVERTIGKKMGTGGSSGVDYLSSTLFKPVFADLWEIRSRF